MKLFKTIYLSLVLLIAYGLQANDLRHPFAPISSIEEQLAELSSQLHHIDEKYNKINQHLINIISEINEHLNKTTDITIKLDLLIYKIKLKEEIEFFRLKEQIDISKIKYLKGIEIIKILYEKTLALDHHFASIRNFNEINKISNPNNYKEFVDIKGIFQKRNRKKPNIDLSGILGSNIYAMVIQSFVSLFSNPSSKFESESSLSKVECILDFTLSMHNDLNTIYFETKFLQQNNLNVRNELQQLFIDFTKPIGYFISLNECRSTDDWGKIKEKLDAYLVQLNSSLSSELTYKKAQKMRINLEFPVDRLIQYINRYNAFINEASRFYQKFDVMLNSYRNEVICAETIPTEFISLKLSITVAIDKFNTAYKPIEINGSKMKEILYGISDYE